MELQIRNQHEQQVHAIMNKLFVFLETGDPFF
jgi:hypothetical protein